MTCRLLLPCWPRLFILLLICLGGCRRAPGRIEPPEIDAAAAGEAAVQQLDKNSDGQLADVELQGSPALASAKARYDADGNGSLSEEEIAAGIRRWAEGKLGAVSVPFAVTLDRRPLEGVQVRLTPEPFLGEAAKGAIGEYRRGSGYLALAPEDRPAGAPNIPLVMPGLYRVEITHPTVKIPAKYNTATTLGIEISQDTLSNAGVSWDLTSK
ncbi:MAG: hypothetical protein DCC67_05265 [Planctomycetota bacterium]|nr:MAG: hypothetical protein DCC67_05265 [Planctomycetota bacterium]